MAHNTGNPIGSADPRDLYDNSTNLDNAVNSSASRSWTDRLGNERLTFFGLEQELNDILVAGGKIFSSVAEGREAVENGQYYYAESSDPTVALTIWKRLNSEESEEVTSTPSAMRVQEVWDFASTADSHARTALRTLSYPNSEFSLAAPSTMRVDQDLNINSMPNYGRGSGASEWGVTAPIAYPFSFFNEQYSSVSVDVNGLVVRAATPRSTVGVTRYPYTNFKDDPLYAKVDYNDEVIFTDTPAVHSPKSFIPSERMFVRLDERSRVLQVVWRHGAGEMLRVTYQLNGYNDLFNWRSTERASIGDINSAIWITIQSSNSDCWPPYVVRADANGDGGGSIYTGGNHGADGGSGGGKTARMTNISFSVDGRRLQPGDAFEDFADEVIVDWKNEVMGYNTITMGRYILGQEISARFVAGDISGFVRVTALEPLHVKTDNGPQAFSGGYSTIHFYNGQLKDRLDIEEADGISSGPFSVYPTWAAVLASEDNGFHGTWVDRGFEAGDGRYLGGSIGFWRRGSGTNTKLYSAIVGTGEHFMSTGDSYEWHGGYFWSPPDAASGIDSAFTFHKRGIPYLGGSLLTTGEGKVNLPPAYKGHEVDSLGVCGISGVTVSSDEYETFAHKIIC